MNRRLLRPSSRVTRPTSIPGRSNSASARVNARVDLEWRAVAARHDRAWKTSDRVRPRGGAGDREFIFREVDDQLESPAGDDTFARVLGHIAQRPEIVDEPIQRWTESVDAVS